MGSFAGAVVDVAVRGRGIDFFGQLVELVPGAFTTDLERSRARDLVAVAVVAEVLDADLCRRVWAGGAVGVGLPRTGPSSRLRRCGRPTSPLFVLARAAAEYGVSIRASALRHGLRANGGGRRVVSPFALEHR